MLLEDWIKSKKMTADEFGKFMGWSLTKAWRIGWGHSEPRLADVMHIVDKTRGKVRPSDILEGIARAKK